MNRYDTWLASSANVPKLLLAFAPAPGLQPSPTGSPAMIEWARNHVAGLEVMNLGPAGHHACEDQPQEIAEAISSWLTRHVLLGPPAGDREDTAEDDPSRG